MNKDELQNTDDDGIWKVDFDSGEGQLLLSISDVKEVEYEPSFDNATHKVNHVSISRSGEHFIFLHRYFVGQRRVD
ncbi:glycosyl transferase, partial [Vibrio breoganii]